MKNSRCASVVGVSSMLVGLLTLAGTVSPAAAKGPAPAPGRPAPAPAPGPPPAPAPTPAPSNSNNHYQRQPVNPWGYGYGYGYGYGDGSGSTSGTTTTPNNKNQPNQPAPDNKSPSASSDSGGSSSHNSPSTQPASTPVDPEVAAATSELNTAMANLRATLSAQPDYAAALAEKQRASEDAAAFHEKGDTGAGDISEIAARGLAASKTISQIERAAMANDPAVQTAKTHLKDALHNAQSASASAKGT